MSPVCTHIFVDFDGTITDCNTFEALARTAMDPYEWSYLENQLESGEIGVAASMERKASFVRMTLDEADEVLLHKVRFDSSFAGFASRCVCAGVELTVISAGIEPVIRKALGRHGLSHVRVVANDLIVSSDKSWKMIFRDSVPNGLDKSAYVRAWQAQGGQVVYMGDGHSDYEAAAHADVRVIKRNSPLERRLMALSLDYHPFRTFAELDPAILSKMLKN